MKSVRLALIVTTLSLGCLFPVVGRAQTSPAKGLPITLPEESLPELKMLLESAMQASPQMISSRLGVETSEANYISSRAARLPSLGASGSYTSSRSGVEDSLQPPTVSDGFYYSASIYQPVFHWGAIKRQTEISNLEISFQALNVAEGYRLLAVAIRRQYLGLIYQQMALRNARFASELADEYLNLQLSKLEAGTLPAGAIVTPKIGALEAKLVVDQAEEAQRFAARTLARLCGVEAIDYENLPEAVPVQTFSDSVRADYIAELASTTDLENTPGALISQLRIEQDKLRYKIVRANLLPKLGLSGSYGIGNNTSVVGDIVVQAATETLSYGLTISWTIFDGLSTRGQKLSALATRRMNEQALRTYLDQTQDRLDNLEKQIGHAARATELAQMRYDLAREAVRLTKDNFDAGVASRNAVSGVTNNAFVAELALSAARQNELMLWTDYISTAGLDPVMDQFPILQERINHGR